MRFLKASALVAMVLTCAVLLLGVVTLRAAPRGGMISAGNGDVNCDGAIDLSDPIFLLHYLFLNGTPPCVAQVSDPCCPDLVQAVRDLRDESQKFRTEDFRGLVDQVQIQAVQLEKSSTAIERIAAAIERSNPRPSDIVNLNFTGTIPGSGNAQLFTVPTGKWLVITKIFKHGDDNIFYFNLIEMVGEEIVIKTNCYFSGNEPYNFSFAFSPGSVVALQNVAQMPSAINNSITFTGYLSDP